MSSSSVQHRSLRLERTRIAAIELGLTLNKFASSQLAIRLCASYRCAWPRLRGGINRSPLRSPLIDTPRDLATMPPRLYSDEELVPVYAMHDAAAQQCVDVGALQP